MPSPRRRAPRCVRPPRPIPVAALLLAALPLASTAAAQDTDADPVRVDPIVVEGTRIPTELDRTGAAVTVITADDIAAAQDREVTDTLRRVPGLNVVQNGGFGGTASVFIRGAGSDQTLVLIDGVAVNDPSAPGNGFDFGGLTASNIARIEILRGPQSTLYGSDAIGGVINITTKSGRAGAGGEAFLEAGVFDTVRGSGTLRGGTERAQGAFTLHGTRSDGISAAESDNGNDERDGFRNVGVAANGAVELTDRLTLDGAFRFSEQRQEFDAFEFGVGPVDGDLVSDEQQLSGRLSATHTALDGLLENELSVKVADVDRRNRDEGQLSFDASGRRETLEYQGTVNATEWLTVAVGAEREENSFTTRSPMRGSQEAGAFAATSGFGLVQVRPVERVTLSAGLRHDASDAFQDETTARVSGAIDIFETGTTLRGVWGEGFKAPTPFQLSFVCADCGAFAAPGVDPAPNTDLKPETSESWEVGVDQTVLPGRLDVSLTYFNQEIDNLIDFDFGGRGYENIAATEQQGVEVALSARPIRWARLSATYTFLDAEDESTGEQLDRRPRHQASGTLSLTPRAGLRLSSTLTFQDTRGDGDATLDAFYLLSLRGSYAVREDIEVFARVENALDQEYQTAAGFGQPDATGFAGVRVQF